jgi:hypothetical protein
MSNLIKFFRNNPNELITLIPIEKENEFFEKIKEVANENFIKGGEVSLTRKQLIDVCLDINGKNNKLQLNSNIFQQTSYGVICLN